jgi:histone arginine demethylase JMJD6
MVFDQFDRSPSPMAPATNTSTSKKHAKKTKSSIKRRRRHAELKARHEKKIRRAKQKVRSSLDVLSGWRRWAFADRSLPPLCKTLAHLPEVDYRETSTEKFIKHYIKKERPCMIKHAMDEWPAMSKWSLEYFQREHAHDKFRVGDNDKGDAVRISMKQFLKYCFEGDARQDDSPLYVFDEKYRLAGGGTNRTLFADYQVPTYFQADLFDLLPDKHRPPHRWVVIGPERSGTNLHVDPLGSGAWNAVISGTKRWVLFPPTTPKHLVTEVKRTYDSEGISWFHSVWTNMSDEKKHELGAVEFVQRAGDCVFVPGGWWHAVVNLEFTIAVTQNFAHPAQAEYIWLKSRYARPRMSQHLLRAVDQLAEEDREYRRVAKRIRSLQTVPRLPDSSSSSSSSDWSSSDVTISDTSSESDSDSRCNCRTCKRKRKRQSKRVSLGVSKPPFSLYGTATHKKKKSK